MSDPNNVPGQEPTTGTQTDPQTPPQTPPQAEPSDPSQAQGTEPKGGTDEHWALNLGPELAQKLKDYTTVDDLLQAAERGKTFAPAKDVDAYDLGIEAKTPEAKLLQDSYKKFCLETGVPPQMARDLAEWNIKLEAQARQAAYETGTKTLRDKWGMHYDANVNGALQALTVLDKRMEGRLSKELAATGGNNNPVVVETLYLLSTLISEDSLAGAASGSNEGKPMSTRDFLKTEVFGKTKE